MVFARKQGGDQTFPDYNNAVAKEALSFEQQEILGTMLRKSVVMLAILLASLASQVYALGLGNVTVESYLNQPLRVRIEILDLGETRLQDVAISLASTDDFERFNIDRVGFLSNIRFSVQATEAGNFVYLTTNQVVREPYLSFILDTRWPNGRLLSEHTVLLDLPVFQDEETASTDTAAVRRPISPVLRAPDSDSRNGGDSTVVDTSAPAAEPVAPPSSVAPILEPEIIAPAEPEPETEAVDPEPAQDLRPPPESAALEEPAPEAEVAVEDPVEQADPEPVSAEPEPAEESLVAAEDEAEAEEPVVVEPEPVAAVETEDAPAQPQTVVTSPSDTLTDIAQQVQPDGLSLQQTMVAIQSLNPDAFIDGNINRMRSGQVLRVPSREEIAEIDAAEAASEVARQNQQIADVQPLAAPADAQPDDQSPQGQLSVVTSDDAIDATSGAGELDDDQNEELDRRIAELENQLALRQEEADRARIEREELDSRLLDLEQQITAAEELIRLQDIQLAQLQESIAQAAAEAEAEAAAQAAQAAAEAEIAAAQTQQRASGGLIDDVMRVLTGNTMIMVAAVALVILLLVVLLIRRNRSAANREEDELDELAEQEFDAAKEEEKALEPPEADEQLEQELDEIIAGSETAEGDSVASSMNHAEIAELIAEGKLDEAEAQLRAHLTSADEDQEARLQLCEVLARAGNEAAFNEQAERIAQEQSPRLDREVATLRDDFAIDKPAVEDDDTVLDFGTGEPEEITDEPAPADEPEEEADDDAASFLDDLGIDLDSFEDDDFEIGDDEESGTDDKEDDAPEDKPDAALLDDLELDNDDVDMTFDLGADSDEGGDEERSEDPEPDVLDIGEADAAAEEEPAAADNDDLDLTAELDADDEPEPDEPEEADDGEEDDSLDLDSDEAEAELTAGDSKEADELDIDAFEFDAADAKPDEVASEDSDEEELDLETFAFDADEVKADLEAKEQAPEGEAAEEIDEEDLLDFDVDEEDFSAPVEAAAETEEDLETFEFDVEEPATEDSGDVEGAAQETDVKDEDEVEIEDVSFDFDNEESPEAGQDDPAPEAAEEDDIDFDLDEFDLGDDDMGSEESDETLEVDVDPDDDEDFLDLDAELEAAGEDTRTTEEVEISFDDEEESVASKDSASDDEDDLDDLEFLSEDDEVEIESVGEAEEVDVLADEDETATKLELAYAYQKMGDLEGAKEILQEVVKEGTDEQIKEANELIASLDQASD